MPWSWSKNTVLGNGVRVSAQHFAIAVNRYENVTRTKLTGDGLNLRQCHNLQVSPMNFHF